MDIALVLDSLRPGAKWRNAKSYKLLVKTWEDESPIPTLEEIQIEWERIKDSIPSTDVVTALYNKVEELEAEVRDLRTKVEKSPDVRS